MTGSCAGVWNAVIDEFAQDNVPIRTIDRSSGFIATDALAVAGADVTWADCGTIKEQGGKRGTDRSVPLAPTTAIYNAHVQGDTATSTVRVTITWASVSSMAPVRCVSLGAWESGFEQNVRAKAEGE
jgi:hypothetical protein